MKTLIYQYWLGNMEPLAYEGKKAMEQYAKMVGADYRFDENPTFVSNLTDCASHMSALRPVFDPEFHEYDKVMYIDCDIFPVNGLTQNIFDEDTGEMAVCEEPHQPEMRKKLGETVVEEKWHKLVKDLYGVELPRTENGLPKVYNSGLVIYSKAGMKKGIKTFTPMQEFINNFRPKFNRPLYYRDQAYVHAMLEVGKMDWRTLDYSWNTQLHWEPKTQADQKGMRPVVDKRDENTKFVHVQLSGSSHWGSDRVDQVVNKPVREWDLKLK